jgi:integrase
MKKHLTDAAIQRFRAPTKGQVEIFDLGYPGLALRIGHGGAKSFVLFHRVNGKLTRTTLGRWPRVSLADARSAWRRVAEGKAPTVEQESGELFSTVVEQWLRLDCAPRHKASSLRVTQRIVDHDLLPALAEKHIDQITRRDIAALIDSVVTRAPAKARAVHAALHRMLRWSVGRGIITSNPMDGMETPGKPSSRERVLTDAELAGVWKACEGVHGDAVKLLILTGARREEIAQLKWSEIEGDAIQLTNGRSKNGQAHIIPLAAPARELLASLPRIADSEFVFTVDGARAIGAWSHAKRKLDAASGIKAWVIHDIRRTVATGLQKLGVSLQTVEAVLGHTSGSRAGIVGVYQRHTFADEKRQTLEAWGKHVMGMTALTN